MSNYCGIIKPDLCCETVDGKHGWDCNYRKILWAILLINGVMFFVELSSGIYSGSQALLADALDFFGDSLNYGISLYVLNKIIATRARGSLIKGVSLAIFGLLVIGVTIYKAIIAEPPKAEIMGIIGFLALFANVLSVVLLYKYRGGDSNRISAWICSRNDAISNIAVILAATGVFFTGTKWPDLFVAIIIAGFALSGSFRIIKLARAELYSTQK